MNVFLFNLFFILVVNSVRGQSLTKLMETEGDVKFLDVDLNNNVHLINKKGGLTFYHQYSKGSVWEATVADPKSLFIAKDGRVFISALSSTGDKYDLYIVQGEDNVRPYVSDISISGLNQFEDKNGNMYFVTNLGLIIQTSMQVSVAVVGITLPVRASLSDNLGNVYIIHGEGSLAVLTPVQIRKRVPIARNIHLGGITIIHDAAINDINGDVYLGTNKGLIKVENLETVTNMDPLAGRNVLTVTIDVQKNVYFTTSEQAFVRANNSINQITGFSNQNENITLVYEKEGRVMFATEEAAVYSTKTIGGHEVRKIKFPTGQRIQQLAANSAFSFYILAEDIFFEDSKIVGIPSGNKKMVLSPGGDAIYLAGYDGLYEILTTGK